MYVQPRNPAREVWTGARMGSEAVTRVSGMPSRDAAELIPALDTLLRSAPRLMIVTDLGEVARPAWLAPMEMAFVDTLQARLPRLEVADLTPQLQRMRGIKSPAEQALIRRAAELTVLAHREAMRAMQPGMNEFEIQALVEYTFRRNGADRPGFASIVASGANASTLHYTAYDRFIEVGEMVVIAAWISAGLS
jgi:Xaa-Pro aminopeptidase